MSKSSIKVTYDIQVGPYDLRLTKEEAEGLFVQLEEALDKKKVAFPLPHWPHIEPIPTTPFSPQNPWEPPNPNTTPCPYPSYPQIWCGTGIPFISKESPQIIQHD